MQPYNAADFLAHAILEYEHTKDPVIRQRFENQLKAIPLIQVLILTIESQNQQIHEYKHQLNARPR